MLGKLLKTAFISTLATAAAVAILRRMENGPTKAPRPPRMHEVDADQLAAPVRDAMLEELQAQL